MFLDGLSLELFEDLDGFLGVVCRLEWTAAGFAAGLILVGMCLVAVLLSGRPL